MAIKNKQSNFKNSYFALIVCLNFSSVSTILAYYDDNEDSQSNEFVAGALDFYLSSSSIGFMDNTEPAGDLMPGDVITRDISVINEINSNEFKYNISTIKIDGDNDFCNALNLEANLEGSVIYNGSLMNLNLDPLAVIGADNQDNWLFSISLPIGFSFTLGQTCNVKFVFEGSQTRHNYNLGEGYNDTEEIDGNTFTATLEKILITKTYYKPDCHHGLREWVEIYNPTQNDIDLASWQICDNHSCKYFRCN